MLSTLPFPSGPPKIEVVSVTRTRDAVFGHHFLFVAKCTYEDFEWEVTFSRKNLLELHVRIHPFGNMLRKLIQPPAGGAAASTSMAAPRKKTNADAKRASTAAMKTTNTKREDNNRTPLLPPPPPLHAGRLIDDVPAEQDVAGAAIGKPPNSVRAKVLGGILRLFLCCAPHRASSSSASSKTATSKVGRKLNKNKEGSALGSPENEVIAGAAEAELTSPVAPMETLERGGSDEQETRDIASSAPSGGTLRTGLASALGGLMTAEAEAARARRVQLGKLRQSQRQLLLLAREEEEAGEGEEEVSGASQGEVESGSEETD